MNFLDIFVHNMYGDIMELAKEAKNKIMIIITLMVFMVAVILAYFTSANIDYKKGYDMSVIDFIK